jgi:hypothetical protein
MKKTNRITSIVLSLIMAFGAIVITAVPATAANPTTQPALQTALNNGGTVTLGGYITLNEPITITKKNVTLDLNGKGIYYADGYAITIVGNKNLTIRDSVNSSAADKGYVSGRGGIWVNGNGISGGGGLYLQSGKIAGENKYDNGWFALCVTNGWAQINGGTIKKVNMNLKKFGYGGTALQVDANARVVLNGGTITGSGHERSAHSSGQLRVNGGKILGTSNALTVSGGYFTQTGGTLEAVHLKGGSITLAGGKRALKTIDVKNRLPISETWKFGNYSNRNGMASSDIRLLAANISTKFNKSKTTVTNALQNAKIGKEGHCFGMSATALLNKQGLINLTKRASNKSNLSQITHSDAIDSAINYYHAQQVDYSPLGQKKFWSEGMVQDSEKTLRTLVDRVLKELVFFEIRIFSVDGKKDTIKKQEWGHAVVLTGVITGPNGAFRILVYDCNEPGKVAYFDISKDYKSFKYVTKSYGIPYEYDSKKEAQREAQKKDYQTAGMYIVPASKMNAIFGWSDIDGPNNNQNLKPQSLALQALEEPSTTLSISVGSSFTIENAEGKTLSYNGETDAITGSMAIIDYNTGKPTSFVGDPEDGVVIDNAVLPGEPVDPSEVAEPEEIEEGETSGFVSGIQAKASFTIPASDGYNITTSTPGIDVTVITPDIFAAASSATASEVVVNKNAGVMISGGRSFDYELSLGVNDSKLDLVSMSGPASYVASLLFNDKDNDPSEIPVKCMGDFSQPDKTTLTIFTDTVDMHEYKVQANKPNLLLTGSSFGSSGEDVNGTLQLFGLNGDAEDQSAVISVEEIEPPHIHEYNITGTEATCTEPGYLTFTCACGDTYSEDQEPLGHDTVFVSESKSGNVIGHNDCTRCDYTEEVIEPADPSALAAKLDELSELTQGNNTNASWAAFQSAIDDAYTVLENINAVQAQLDNALSSLTTASNGLTANDNITPQPRDILPDGTITLVRKTDSNVFRDAISAYNAATGKTSNSLRFESSGKIDVDSSGKITYKFAAIGKATVKAYDGNTLIDSIEVNVKWTWHWILVILLFGWLYL